ncbi:hypothetical protein SAMN05444412_103337 [Rhodonellum ikkaensis]|uniref:Uncharacterized protein n=1 Tax=Rhodonellum ikkaensis TaxID=336829 RepID=A0A1H3NNK2_9BACT|nr:hypothetical protein SAMN05444412_103337 [Rhodonellum ikkaensis]
MEIVKGGDSFSEMMFYATASQYHLGQLSSSNGYFSYHAAGIGYYSARLMVCM